MTRIESARLAKRLTQSELASLAGVSTRTVNKLEAGYHSPSVRSLLKIARTVHPYMQDVESVLSDFVRGDSKMAKKNPGYSDLEETGGYSIPIPAESKGRYGEIPEGAEELPHNRTQLGQDQTERDAATAKAEAALDNYFKERDGREIPSKAPIPRFDEKKARVTSSGNNV